jgi:dihydrofolate reductase
MGRRTWDSLPFKPLKNRLNIVVSSGGSDAPVLCSDVAGALAHAMDAGHRRIYGIGGAGIYAALLPLADRLLITEVDVAVPGADTFFPPFVAQDWHLVGTLALPGDDPACVVNEYVRPVA